MNTEQIVETRITDRVKCFGISILKWTLIVAHITLIFAMLGEHISAGLVSGLGVLTALYLLVWKAAKEQRKEMERGFEIQPIGYFTLREMHSSTNDTDLKGSIEYYLQDGVVTVGEFDILVMKFMNGQPSKKQKDLLLKEIHKTIEVI